MTNKIVIYTAIAGYGRDFLKDPEPITGVDYVCFTDQKTKSKIWKIKEFNFKDKSTVLTAKHPKILPHLYFPEHEISIWVDGNIMPKKNIVSECTRYLQWSNMALHEHPRRCCLYQEIDYILKINDIPEDGYKKLIKQKYQYNELGMPKYYGLWECGVLFRNHNESEIINAMEFWWNEIIKNSQARDQISFAYTIWKLGISLSVIKGNLRKKDYITYSSHNDIMRTNYKKRRIIMSMPKHRLIEQIRKTIYIDKAKEAVCA